MSISKNKNPKDTELPVFPPCDLLAEQSVLGAMLLGGSDAMETAAALLAPEHFYRDAHGEIFRAMEALHGRGAGVDVVNLQTELKARGSLDEIGGLVYLMQLGDIVPTTANLPDYIDTVRGMAARRCLMVAGSKLSAMAQAPDVPLSDMIAATEAETALATRLAAGAESEVLATRCLADIQAETVDWLWQGRVPFGAITVLDGDPGKGKTTIALDLAARVTTGTPMPESGETSEPGNVLLLCAEDSAAHTLKPRLDAAGADMWRVFVETQSEGGDPVYLPDHASGIAAAVRKHKARLVVIDPLMAFLGADIKSNSDQDVRRALRPLVAIAQETGAAFLILRHLNKGSQGSNALYRGGGSIGITGAARSVLMVVAHPEDENLRVLAGVKMNLCRMPESLAFSLEADRVDSAVRVHWRGVYDKGANELLAASIAATQPQRPQRESAQDKAADFLAEQLAGGGLVAARDLLARAKETGIGERALATAKDAAKKAGTMEYVKSREGDATVWFCRTVQLCNCATVQTDSEENADFGAANCCNTEEGDGAAGNSTGADLPHTFAQLHSCTVAQLAETDTIGTGVLPTRRRVVCDETIGGIMDMSRR